MSDKSEAQVAIGEDLSIIGKLAFETDGARQSSVFIYGDAWINSSKGFDLSPYMRRQDLQMFGSGRKGDLHGVLPSCIADCAPDAWGRGLIRKTLKREPTEMDYLLAADDLTRQGALRFLDADGRPVATDVPAIPRLVDLADLVALAQDFERDPEMADEKLKKLAGAGGSLGGARPKASLDDEGALSIIKFTSINDTRPIERMEVATLALAKQAGIKAATARIELGDTPYPVAVIRRFDRRGTRRIPYISARTMVDIKGTDGAYYTDMAEAMRAYCYDVPNQLRELYRRILFTILVSNNDDHMKNHGFVYAGNNQWVLSEAFDINPQPERQRHLETGISELSGNEADIEAALEASPFFDIPRDEALTILREVHEAIDSGWKDACRAAGMSGVHIKSYAPAFEHEEAEKARRLLASS